MYRWIRKTHKWVAGGVGVFLLVWLVSGIVMVTPRVFPNQAPVVAQRSLDLNRVMIGPDEAVKNLLGDNKDSAEIHSVTLVQLNDVPAYRIALRAGGSRTVSAETGREYEITADMAERLVREGYSIRSSDAKVARVDQHDLNYSWGALPVYRVSFDDEPGIFYHVSTADGALRRSDGETRVRTIIESLHTFEPLRVVTHREVVRKGLLVLFSCVGIGAAVTGYYLLLGNPRQSVGR